MTRKDDERRKYKRFAADSLVAVEFGDSTTAKARLINVSDGGAYLSLAGGDARPAVGAKVAISFKLPRSTPNTFMFEDVQAHGRVVRAKATKDGDSQPGGLGLQFIKPLDLQIEV
jgi:c-di-GMP-binding flagellar brake protein YcgR